MANTLLDNPTLATAKEVAYVSTFPPRKCGIATFTADLFKTVDQLKLLKNQTVISIDGRRLFRPPTEATEHKIGRDFEEDYLLMADFLNHSSIDVVNIQHEFGIFGGEAGEYICSFLDRLKKPVATTLHTVLPVFEGKTLEVFEKIVNRSQALVVLNKTTKELMRSHGVPDWKVRVIPHGCPDLPLVDSDSMKPKLGLQDRVVLSTFGLLSRGKGIENVLEALPEIVAREPKIVYYVLGVTHPQVRNVDGEEYRNMLHGMVKDLGLRDHVRFLNRFLSKPELYSYLQATDVYITPYLSPNQVSSGTLSYALAAGKAVVSTPYLHAKEALGDGRGVFCRFSDPDSIAQKVTALIEDRNLCMSIGQRAYIYSRAFTWPKIAKMYLDLFDELTSHEDELSCPQEMNMPSAILH